MIVRFFFPILVLAILSLTSCAGYRFNANNNPLIGYDIRSVAVPMFINRSVIPELAAPMTKEVIFALNDYSGLKVFSGNEETADAVLIGIIESRDHYNEVVRSTEELFSNDNEGVKSSIGGRSPFYYPVTSSYGFSLRIVLIRKPNKEELELMSSNLGQYLNANPKVVLSDEINLTGAFSRVVGESTVSRGGGKVNFVKNKGIFEKSLHETAANAAKAFKQVVLNAF